MKKLLLVLVVVILVGCGQNESATEHNWENDVKLIEKVNMLTTNFTNGNHFDHEVAETYEELIEEMKSLEVDVNDDKASDFREGIVGHAKKLDQAFNERNKNKISEHVSSLNEIRSEYKKYVSEE